MTSDESLAWQKWALGALLSLVFLALSGSGWLYADLSQRVTSLREVDGAYQERITRLEENMKFIRESLDRIERKIDTR